MFIKEYGYFFRGTIYFKLLNKIEKKKHFKIWFICVENIFLFLPVSKSMFVKDLSISFFFVDIDDDDDDDE